MSINPESPSSQDSLQAKGAACWSPLPAHHASLLSIHDSFLKLCPPGKYYKEATLTMDQVSSLPALRVSPVEVGVEGVEVASLGFTEAQKVLVWSFHCDSGGHEPDKYP